MDALLFTRVLLIVGVVYLVGVYYQLYTLFSILEGKEKTRKWFWVPRAVFILFITMYYWGHTNRLVINDSEFVKSYVILIVIISVVTEALGVIFRHIKKHVPVKKKGVTEQEDSKKAEAD